MIILKKNLSKSGILIENLVWSLEIKLEKYKNIINIPLIIIRNNIIE